MPVSASSRAAFIPPTPAPITSADLVSIQLYYSRVMFTILVLQFYCMGVLFISFQIRNPNTEFRNKTENQISNVQNVIYLKHIVLDFGYLDLFRASDL